MPKLLSSIPSYRLHRQSGQAIVTLCGKDYLLGKHGTAASKAEYNRRVAEWIASGRRAPATPETDLNINELIKRYRVHTEAYYRGADGKPSREAENIRYALRPLRETYGATSARKFGPLALEAVREKMIEAGWSRKSINRQVDRIRQMFRWAVSKQLLPSSVYESLRALDGLRAGRSKAQESKPVQPINDAIVEATTPHLSNVVRAMVQLQRLTGTRPGEICSMKIGDIDRSGNVWVYKPTEHKTQHHGKSRVIFIGTKAQDVLRPFMLKLDTTAHVFSPLEAVAEMRQARAAARKTPASCGNKPGSNVKRHPKRTPKNFYDVNGYRRAIARACKVAEVESWHPHRLRHTAATDIRRQFGLEAAQHVLGHSTTAMTEIYAEKNQEIARAVAAKIG
jgi:integrase